MLSPDLIESLFPEDLPGPEHWEERYPPRDLPAGAEVTRFSPSPTGYLHIGGVYVAIIDADLARQTGGRYLLRIEDTDQARVTEGAVDQFADALTYFTISPQEDDLSGHYGPYVQSSRAEIYLTYVRELLRQDRAYLDFSTKAELEEITAKQRAAGALPGYYGKWALWRDASEEQVREKLDAQACGAVRQKQARQTGPGPGVPPGVAGPLPGLRHGVDRLEVRRQQFARVLDVLGHRGPGRIGVAGTECLEDGGMILRGGLGPAGDRGEKPARGEPRRD